MNTQNWRIRTIDDDNFFIEADLPKPYCDNHYPRVELMQDDYGDHNGYTNEMRTDDATLIVKAPKMQDAITDILAVLAYTNEPDIHWIKTRLTNSLK